VDTTNRPWIRAYIGLDYSFSKFGWGVVIRERGHFAKPYEVDLSYALDFAGVSRSSVEPKSLRITDLYQQAAYIIDSVQGTRELAARPMVIIEDFAYSKTEYVSYDLALAQGALRHELNMQRLEYLLVSPGKVKSFQKTALPNWVREKADLWKARGPKKDVLDGLTLALIGADLDRALMGLSAHKVITSTDPVKVGLSGLMHQHGVLWIDHEQT